MANLTDSIVDICDHIFDRINANKAELGIAEVYYGDQNKIPVTPAVCVEPDEKPRELKGAQRMTRVTFRVYVIVYFAQIGSVQDNRRQADLLAEQIEVLIHQEPTLNGIVIHGMCTDIVSGYITKDRTLMRSSRITYEGLSQKLLPGTG